MTMVTLNDVKYQCRIELECNDDDELLMGYIYAALEHCQTFMGRKIYHPPVPIDDPDGIEFNYTIRQAMLLLIGHWYANREATIPTANELPFGVRQLLQLYRIMGT